MYMLKVGRNGKKEDKRAFLAVCGYLFPVPRLRPYCINPIKLCSVTGLSDSIALATCNSGSRVGILVLVILVLEMCYYGAK